MNRKVKSGDYMIENTRSGPDNAPLVYLVVGDAHLHGYARVEMTLNEARQLMVDLAVVIDRA